MHRIRIKICGVMRPHDARLASQAGADAVGMIFHPLSRRNIPLELGHEIMSALGPFVTPIGVFVDADISSILLAANVLSLMNIQLNGNESPDYVARLSRAGLRILKAFRVDHSLPQTLAQWRAALPTMNGSLVGLVLDTPSHAPGGAGIPNNWELIREFQQAGHFHGLPPIVAAGGLDPQNVAQVIQTIQPFAVDVSSGVESQIGQKCSDKIQSFVAAARAADRQ